MMKTVLWIAAVSVILICSFAHAVEFRGDGYKLNYPDGWTVAGQDIKAVAKDRANALAQGPPAKGYIDVAFLSPDQPDRQARISVVVGPGSPTIDESHLPHLLDAMFKQSAAAGFRAELLDSRIVPINGRSFVFARTNTTGPIFPWPMRTWNLLGTAGGKMYMFGLASSVDASEGWEPVFVKVVQSVRLDSPDVEAAGPGLDTNAPPEGKSGSEAMGWFGGLPLAVKATIIMGLTGGLIAGAIGVLRRLRKKPATPEDLAPPAQEA